VWLALATPAGAKVACWTSAEAGGEGSWRVSGVKAVSEEERHRVQQLLVLPASRSVLCWLTSGDVAIFDAATLATIHTAAFVRLSRMRTSARAPPPPRPAAPRRPLPTRSADSES